MFCRRSSRLSSIFNHARRRFHSVSTVKMHMGLAQKYEINSDMGEGFGRWKMVC